MPDSILPEMVLLELIVLELCALPETIPTWMQTGGGSVPNSNPVWTGLQKNSAPDRAAAQAEVQGLGGLAGASVKFGKGTQLFRWLKLVAEVPYTGEEHCQPQPVGGCDYFGIALRASGLDDGGCASSGNFLDAVGKREERVGGGDRSL